MHEVALAANIIEIASDAARKAGSSRVALVRLRVGRLTCTDADSLRFAFEVSAVGTTAQGAGLDIETVPVTVTCSTCGKPGTPEDPLLLTCPHCDSPFVTVVTGRELVVTSIEVEQ